MHRELFGFVKSYGLMLAISFVVGTWLSLRRGRVRGLDPDTVMDLVFGVFVSSIVGVRLWYVLTHLDRFDPWYRAFFIWDGGLTLYGGIIAAILTVWWLARRRGIPFLTVADVMAPAVVLGIGITRIGCFLGGCCFGTPTTCPLGVRFPATAEASRVFGVGVAVHPAQLYASASAFTVFALLLLWERRPSPRGATFFRFLLLYGVQRFLIDFVRYYESSQMLLGLTTNQWISLLLVIVGGGALVGFLRGGAEEGVRG
jgi:phosphatidylglycerol:prolipoprotein diacylglycerol transferase